MAEERKTTRWEELIHQLEICRDRSAGRSVPHLRAAWFAVSALIFAAVMVFLFAQDLGKLWGIPFVLLAVAIVVWLGVRYARVERELRLILKELAALEKPLPQTPSDLKLPEHTHRANRQIRRIV